MYRLTINATVKHLKLLCDQEYRDYVVPLITRTFVPYRVNLTTIQPPAELAHYMGLKWYQYKMPCYTNSLISIWKRGRIIDTYVDFQYLDLRNLDTVAIASMINQLTLTKIGIPLDILLVVAKELDLEILFRISITFPRDRWSYLARYLREILSSSRQRRRFPSCDRRPSIVDGIIVLPPEEVAEIDMINISDEHRNKCKRIIDYVRSSTEFLEQYSYILE
jgi:hypothetical protein